MAKTNKTLPKKWGIVIYSLIFIICQMVFLVSMVGNMPLLRDTIRFNQSLVYYFNYYYIYACIVAGTVEIILGLVSMYLFIDKRWPTLLTLITCMINIAICCLGASGVFILDLRNVYFSLQATFAIPIISIFLSSVFLMDDTIDLINDRYEMHVSKLTSSAQKLARERKEKLLAAKEASLESKEILGKNEPLSPEETVAQHLQSIADAAKIALPGLSDKEKNEE